MNPGLVAGLRSLDLALIFLYGISVVLILRLFGRSHDQDSRPGSLLTLAGGFAIAVGTWLIDPSASRELPSRVTGRPLAPIVTAAGVVLALGYVDLLFTRIGPRILRIATRPLPERRSKSDRVTAIFLVGLVVLTAAPLLAISKRLERAQGVTNQLGQPLARPSVFRTKVKATKEATYQLPGPPLGLVFRGRRDGYITLSQGEILHFELDPKRRAKLLTNVAARGLGQVRGVAIMNRWLFVSEITRWPCPTRPNEIELAGCFTSSFPKTSADRAELRIIDKARGRISRFDIRDDGSLGPRRTLVDDLPVVNRDHAVNGIVAGPDGWLYSFVGNVDHLFDAPQKLASVRRHNLDLLGTVIRFRPTGRDLQIVARGLRNAYGFVFAPDGRLYTVDNEGPSFSGPRQEELLVIKKGADYGFPYEGSSPPYHVRTDGPLLTLDTRGSAGIDWAPAVGLPPGILTGSCGGLRYVRLRPSRGAVTVIGNPEVLRTVRGCLSIVRATPDDRLLIGDPFSMTVDLLRISH